MRKALIGVCVAMVAAAAFATVPATDQYLPALGHALGAAGSNGVRPWWRGDVWIFNPSGSQTANVKVYLLLRQPNPNPEFKPFTVAPGDTLYLPDVIYSTFGYDNLYAGLRFQSDIPVLVTGESYDANVTVVGRPQGTAGQFFAALPANLAIGSGESSDLPGFDQDGIGTAGTFRSNLAVVETTGNPVNFRLQVFDGSGNLINYKDYSLGGREVGQINTVITDVTGGTGTNDRVHLVVTGGTGKMFAVGSRIDNRTGDPSTIDMEAIHLAGQFEGIVLDAATGTKVDGGMQLAIAGNVLTNFRGIAGIPCGTDSFTLDFSPSAAVAVPVAANGTFTTSLSVQYTDGTNNLFTTNWTINGARAADGTWSGTLTSDTSGGTTVGGYNYGTCNVTGVTRQWRAAWTGGNS